MSSHRHRTELVVGASAWLETIVGVLFVITPGVVCSLVFGARPDAVGIPLGRFCGIGLATLGVVCLHSRHARPHHVVVELFAFNVAVAVLFAWFGLTSALQGVLLWPAVILHSVIAAALLPDLLARRHGHGDVRGQPIANAPL